MAELLVIFSCMNNTNCDITSDLYLQQHPTLQEFIKTEERMVRQTAGVMTVDYLLPTVGLVSGRDVDIKISSVLRFKLNVNSSMLIFRQEF